MAKGSNSSAGPGIYGCRFLARPEESRMFHMNVYSQIMQKKSVQLVKILSIIIIYP